MFFQTFSNIEKSINTNMEMKMGWGRKIGEKSIAKYESFDMLL
jgi:hypothetical protein